MKIIFSEMYLEFLDIEKSLLKEAKSTLRRNIEHHNLLNHKLSLENLNKYLFELSFL